MVSWGDTNIENILKNHSGLKCIIFSRYCGISHFQSMIKAGVKGYLHFTSSRDQVIEAIRTVLQGDVYFCPKSATALSEEIKNGANHNSLTEQEQKILIKIADSQSTKEIADFLCLSESTIKTHRRNIMNKLDLHDVQKLTKYAILNNLTTLE